MQSSKPDAIRVLLVDDHEVVRVGLRQLLSGYPSILVVGESATAADAIRKATDLKPDIILMDVRLRDESGVEACREILAVDPNARVIFLTSFSEDESLLAAVLAGAQGYVLKDIDTPSLLNAIQTVAAGQSILDPAVVERAIRWVQRFASGHQAKGDNTLSEQEERVLALVAEGLTNKEIAASLNLSDKTVRNYLTNVFKKLRITRRTQAAAFFVKCVPHMRKPALPE
ncbi:MAG: response regulator transcription factor [Nitrospira sp.]|nr:response regulator transcription factor [Nitrospira sp.]MCP9443334.1 response regulator transcription factor [Nitrospira sp.]